MARKNTLPSAVPEPDEDEETSEEESRESEDGEEGEESEEEAVEEKAHEKNPTRIQPLQANKKPLTAPQAPDSPPSPNVSDFTVKAVSPGRRAPASKRNLQVQKDDVKESNGRKRAKSSGDDKEVKVSAVSASGAVARVWSEEDEIAVLEGMIDYQKSIGLNPSNDMAAFHEFIKGKLKGDMSKTQLYEKVRRLKKKFFTNVEKAERAGEDLVFSSAHESKIFVLSKKIWVDEANSSAGISGISKEGEKKGVAQVAKIVKGGEKDAVRMDDVMDDGGDFESKYPHLNQSFDLHGLSFLREDLKSYLKENLSLINSAKAKELEEKWKKLSEQEAEFFFKRMSLMGEQAELVLNALKKR